ncbi:MAG: RCC1 repeat-containing protein [Proteobacteria bacterium]|nr:RCC1 repeat-containing protein [Pseudomonadota bacterium]
MIFLSKANGMLGQGEVVPTTPVALPVLEGANQARFSGAIDVALGSEHTCVRRKDGSVWCWGYNVSGQLGDGSTMTRLSPVRVTGLDGSAVEQLVAGYGHTCARRTDGSVWCWGSNSSGELGQGDTNNRTVATRVGALGTAVVEVAAGSSRTCARLSDGTLWCWGENRYRQVGDGTSTNRLDPTQVVALGTTVQAVAIGNYGSFALRADGSLWGWGATYLGTPDGAGIDGIPAALSTLGTNVVEVGAGMMHGCARLRDNTVWCWGLNNRGQVGDRTMSTRTVPVRVTTLGTAAAELQVGGNHACARRLDGQLWCWGMNEQAQLGDGVYMNANTPHAVLGLQCECGDGVCSRSETRESCPVDCRQASCGDGQCTGTETHATCSRDCPAPPPTTALSLGAQFGCSHRTDGSLWCWGNGAIGAARKERLSPVAITTLGSGVVALAEDGVGTGCAIRADRSLWCWGTGPRLGDGSSGTRTTPARVTALGTQVLQVAISDYHACARRSDGTMWCWGSGMYGALGDGSTTSSSASPLEVTALGTSVAEIGVGIFQSCARRTDGSLWCWGTSIGGNLGDGTTLSHAAPAKVTGLGTAVIGISSGGSPACARTADGSLWCWGPNRNGNVGDGTTTERFVPVRVTTLGTSVAQIAEGPGSHKCARRTDGTLWCWGWNGYGQLGNGATDFLWGNGYQQLRPVQVTNLGTSVVDVAVGNTHTCARRSDGSVWCWGLNNGSQLGTDATTEPVSSIPQRVAPCGDGICSLPERQSGGCAADCMATCGDCVCDGVLEDADSCPADCVAGNTCTPGSCGDGKCDATENCQLCATDCGSCYPI